MHPPCRGKSPQTARLVRAKRSFCGGAGNGCATSSRRDAIRSRISSRIAPALGKTKPHFFLGNALAPAAFPGATSSRTRRHCRPPLRATRLSQTCWSLPPPKYWQKSVVSRMVGHIWAVLIACSRVRHILGLNKRSGFGPLPMAHQDEIEITRDELQKEAEALAQKVLGTSARDAWDRLRRGELEGTLFASKMVRLRALLGENDNHDAPVPAAAE
jgi:hypothetical protein